MGDLKSTILTIIPSRAISTGDTISSNSCAYEFFGKVEAFECDEVSLTSTFIINGNKHVTPIDTSVTIVGGIKIKAGETLTSGYTLTNSDIVLLSFLEVINVAGGIARDNQGGLTICGGDNEWFDLAMNAQDAHQHLIEIGVDVAHLSINNSGW